MSTRKLESVGLNKGILAVIFGMSVILAGIIPGHFAAAAEQNPNVVVDVTSIVTRAGGQETPDRPLKQWNEASLYFTWDATQANVKADDYFTIDLPDLFDIPNATGSFPIETSGKTAGICTLTGSQIKCTFTKDQATADAEKLVLKGNGKAIVRATKITDSTSVEFILNGVSKSITLPQNKGIAPTIEGGQFYQEKFGKHAESLTPDKNELKWTISFGLAEINRHRETAGLPPLPSGAISTIELRDKLSAGQNYLGKTRIERYRKDNNSAPEVIHQNFDSEVSLDGFIVESTYNAAKTEVTYKITGPFANETSYYFMYWTAFDGDKPKAGVEYKNEVELIGTKVIRTETRTAVSNFEITVQEREGYGTFNVLKFLSGDAAILAPSGYAADGQKPDGKYQLHVKYVIPESFIAKIPAEFTPPGNYDAASRTGEIDIPIAPGKKFTFDPVLPEGTEVTLTEKPVETVPNALWQDETFTSTDQVAPQGSTLGKTAQFTIADRKNYSFKLTNLLNYQTGVIKLTKTIAGIDPAPTDKEFTFNYTCAPSNKSGKIVVTAGGPAVASDPLNYGDTCTLTEEGATAEIEGYELKPLTIPTVTIDAAEKPVTVNNEYKLSQGFFSVLKLVEGTEGNDGANKQFTIEATCTGSMLPQPQNLVFNLGHDTAIPSAQLPVGTSCELREDVTKVAIDGYNFVGVTFSMNPLVISKEAQVVTVTNTYTKQKLGNLELSKVVVGAPVSEDREFTVTATCTNAVNQAKVIEELHVSKGTPATLKNPLPVGSTCTFTEDTVTAAVDGHTLEGHVFEPAQVTIGEQPVAVKLTNTYSLNKGTFKVSKVVSGDLDKAKDKSFKFTYTCTAPAGGTDAPIESELTVVAGGPAVASKEIPQGYTCKVKESAAEAELAGFTLTAPNEQTVTIGSTAQELTFQNVYVAKTGNLKLTKVVTGATAPAGKTFSVTANCTNALTKEKVTETLTLTPGTPVSLQTALPLGSTCTFTEDTAAAGIDRHTLVNSVFVPETATIGEDPVEVTLTNTYSLNKGIFKVSKTVTGDLDKAKDKSFSFTYTCSAPAGVTAPDVTGELTVVAGGPAVASKEIPEGFTCHVSETDKEVQLDGFTWKAPAAQDVVIGTDAKELSFVNAYERVLGNLVVSKQVKGADVAADHEFTVEATCINADTGEKNTEKLVVTNGKSASLVNPLPVGSTCTFAEDQATVKLAGYDFVGAEFNVKEVTIGADEAQVTVVNNYKKVVIPPKQPKDTPKVETPKPKLPKTGITSEALYLAAGLALSGAALLVLRRKQTRD